MSLLFTFHWQELAVPGSSVLGMGLVTEDSASWLHLVEVPVTAGPLSRFNILGVATEEATWR